MTPDASAPATLSKSGDRELVIEWVFDAPRALVWDAMTNPEHVWQWYGKRALTSRLEYQTQQDRDGGAGSWSMWGGSAWAPESLERLAEVVATLA